MKGPRHDEWLAMRENQGTQTVRSIYHYIATATILFSRYLANISGAV